jgi:hypothetical protein
LLVNFGQGLRHGLFAEYFLTKKKVGSWILVLDLANARGGAVDYHQPMSNAMALARLYHWHSRGPTEKKPTDLDVYLITD